jgi:hypothetical protein
MLFNREIYLVWFYWLLTDLLLIGGLAGWTTGFMQVILLSNIQILHFLYREGRITAFSVQVCYAYLLIILLGQWQPLSVLLWLQAIGTTATLLFDYCLLARMMALMPWNRDKPLSSQLIRQVMISTPVNGSILERI